jgi:hypothetical protein
VPANRRKYCDSGAARECQLAAAAGAAADFDLLLEELDLSDEELDLSDEELDLSDEELDLSDEELDLSDEADDSLPPADFSPSEDPFADGNRLSVR